MKKDCYVFKRSLKKKEADKSKSSYDAKGKEKVDEANIVEPQVKIHDDRQQDVLVLDSSTNVDALLSHDASYM